MAGSPMGAYASVSIETADPGTLIVLLFDGALRVSEGLSLTPEHIGQSKDGGFKYTVRGKGGRSREVAVFAHARGGAAVLCLRARPGARPALLPYQPGARVADHHGRGLRLRLTEGKSAAEVELLLAHERGGLGRHRTFQESLQGAGGDPGPASQSSARTL